MSVKDFFQSKVFQGILKGIGVLLVLLITFQAGVMFGFHRANFAYHWSSHYPENFFPAPHGPTMKGHGAFGDILKIDNSTLTVKGADEAEKIVIIGRNTVLENAFDKIKLSDLKVNDHVLVMGSPNESGQIEAKVIRVLPQNSVNIK